MLERTKKGQEHGIKMKKMEKCWHWSKAMDGSDETVYECVCASHIKAGKSEWEDKTHAHTHTHRILQHGGAVITFKPSVPLYKSSNYQYSAPSFTIATQTFYYQLSAIGAVHVLPNLYTPRTVQRFATWHDDTVPRWRSQTNVMTKRFSGSGTQRH